MDLILYHPEHGYYAKPEDRAVGRKGDFFTSVSVGEMFGFLLADKMEQAWGETLDRNVPLTIVEQGAHDGQLAHDIVTSLLKIPGVERDALSYRIIDPRASTREFLTGKFSELNLGDIIEAAESAEEAQASQGIFLCNELLDAFAVDRITFVGGEWKESQVSWENGQPCWSTRDLSPRLRPFTEELGFEFPEGYTTEICPSVGDWINTTSTLFDSGLWWIIDYGFESDDYFSPHRKTGTLRCYREHRATEDPFEFPGETDITAHVNFSHLRKSAEEAGLEWLNYTDQHHFLTHCARRWLLSLEGTPASGENAKRLRQFQTLTHPGLMGQQFKVAELGRGLS